MTPPDDTGDTDDDDPDYQPAIANFSRNMFETDIEIVLPTPMSVLPDSDDTEANCSVPKEKKSKKSTGKKGIGLLNRNWQILTAMSHLQMAILTLKGFGLLQNVQNYFGFQVSF